MEHSSTTTSDIPARPRLWKSKYLASFKKVSPLGELILMLALVALIRLLPRLVLQEDSFVLIHDNLDSDFVYRVLIAKPGRPFDGEAIVTELLGGQARWTYPSSLKLGSFLFWLFPPFERLPA